MFEAIEYQKMLVNISKNEFAEDIVGILITRPELHVGKEIMKCLNYYHHASGECVNFYLPGYGAYWYGAYPNGEVVSKIDDVDWSFSDKLFNSFKNDLENYSKWEYSGESELMLLSCKNGVFSFDNAIIRHLDQMLRYKVINSVSAFFESLFRVKKKIYIE